jgi:hypothetical protein
LDYLTPFSTGSILSLYRGLRIFLSLYRGSKTSDNPQTYEEHGISQ